MVRQDNIFVYSLCILSFNFSLVDKKFPKDFTFSFASGTIQVTGGFIGSITGGLVCEKFGRKIAMITDRVIITCAAIVIALAPNAICLYFGEFLVGYIFGTQKSSILPYTGEICEAKVRRRTEIMYTMFIAVGGSMAFLLGNFFSYRQIEYFVALVGAINVLLLFFCPESPRWLISKGNITKAKAEMMRLRNNFSVSETEIQTIQSSMQHVTLDQVDNVEKPKESDLNWCRRTLSMFNQEAFRRPFLVLLVLYPIGRILTGGPSLNFYIIQILNHSKLAITSFQAAAILAVYQLLITLLCCFLAQYLPRRPLLIYSSLLMAIGSLGFGTILYFDENEYYVDYMKSHIYTQWIPIVALALIFTGQNGGFKLATSIYMGQLLPAKTRSLGISLISFLTTVIMCVEVTLTPYIIEFIGVYGLFWFFGAITFGVLIFACLYVPEVFKRSLEDIENYYRRKC